MDKLVDDLLEESIKVYKKTGPIGDSSKALWQFITEVCFILKNESAFWCKCILLKITLSNRSFAYLSKALTWLTIKLGSLVNFTLHHNYYSLYFVVS